MTTKTIVSIPDGGPTPNWLEVTADPGSTNLRFRINHELGRVTISEREAVELAEKILEHVVANGMDIGRGYGRVTDVAPLAHPDCAVCNATPIQF